MLTATFDDVETALATVDAPIAAAEAHGSLCGALTTVGGLSAHAWLGDLLPEPALSEDALRSRNLLESLFAETASALSAQDMEFEPVLPDDAAPIEQRVAALAAWCGGFLYGFGLGDRTGAEVLSDEVNEVLRDFGEISRAVVDSDETAESSEESYAELVEYLRAATQLTYDELAAQRNRAVGS